VEAGVVLFITSRPAVAPTPLLGLA
jgi:hypothetical protein